jgi:hypothetical protein
MHIFILGSIIETTNFKLLCKTLSISKETAFWILFLIYKHCKENNVHFISLDFLKTINSKLNEKKLLKVLIQAGFIIEYKNQFYVCGAKHRYFRPRKIKIKQEDLFEPVQFFYDLWQNYKHEKLPDIKLINEQRKKAIKARWQEMPDVNYWKQVLQKINECDFLLGNNNRGWVANFDFFIRPMTHIKVMEGFYSNYNNKMKNNNLFLLKKVYEQK